MECGVPPLEKIPKLELEGVTERSSPASVVAAMLSPPSLAKPPTANGLRRGFLNQRKSQTGKRDVKLLEPSSTTSQSHVFREVQDAMKYRQNIIPPELVHRIASSSHLQEAMIDPQFERVIGIMCEDPKRGQTILANDERLRSLFGKYVDEIGKFYEESTHTEETSTNSFQQRELEPETAQLLNLIQKGVKLDPRRIKECNPVLWNMLAALIESGILKIEHV
jgi:hypothetical protein